MVFKEASERMKATWESNYSGVAAIPYGVLWDTSSSSPTLTRCDQNGDAISLSASNFNSHPVWGGMKRCVLTAGGAATYGSDAKGTGLTTTSNYVMVEIPQAHVITWDDGDYIGFAMADMPFSGNPSGSEIIASSVHPWFYQRGNSSTPLEKAHVGAYKSVDDGGTKLGSKSGVAPLASIILGTAESRANAIGTGWGITNIWYQSLMQLLMYIEFGTLDIQTALGPGYTNTGNTGPQTTGASDSLMATNGSGGGTNQQGVNYRGINNPYGDLFEFRIGWNSVDGGYRVIKRDGTGTLAAEMASGSYEATVGITPITSQGMISDVLRVDPLKLLFIPSAVSGSSSTYMCDFFAKHTTTGATNVLGASGSWLYDLNAGPGLFNTGGSAATTNAHCGSRIEYLGASS